MTIESPFGSVEVYFYRNNHCSLQARGAGFITINGVELTFHKEFAIVDGEWQPINTDSNGKPYRNTMLNLRFYDWQRNGSPSSSAYNKLLQWIQAFFVADLNRGVYTKQLNEAERNFFKNAIDRKHREIAEANELIARLQTALLADNAILNALP